MPRDEWKHIGVDAAIDAPISRAPHAVVLLGLVRNPKLVQLVREGLIRVDVILVEIVARPGGLAAAIVESTETVAVCPSRTALSSIFGSGLSSLSKITV